MPCPLFSIVLGIVYIATPIDFIPEVVPIVGSLDDVVVGGGAIILGIYSWVKNKKRRRLCYEISLLIDQNRYVEATELLLRNEGYQVKRLETGKSSSEAAGNNISEE